MPVRYLIDEPTEFDDVEVWRKFLAQMESALDDDPGNSDLTRAAEKARRIIADHEAGLPPF